MAGSDGVPKKRKAGDLLKIVRDYSLSLDKLKYAKYRKLCGTEPENRSVPVFAQLPENGPVTVEQTGFYRENKLKAKTKVDAGSLPKIVALDCEMVRTVTQSMALARCSIVGLNGERLYDKIIKPKDRITNYVTRYSGIYPHMMKNATPYDKARKEIIDFLQKKLVVGHTLQSDFRSIGCEVDPDYIVDISKMPPVRQLLGQKPGGKDVVGLAKMTKRLFGEDIQTKEHCSVEDAWATMKVFKLAWEPWVKSFRKLQEKMGPKEKTVSFSQQVANGNRKLTPKSLPSRRKPADGNRKLVPKSSRISIKVKRKPDGTLHIPKLAPAATKKISKTLKEKTNVMSSNKKKKRKKLQNQAKPFDFSVYLQDKFWLSAVE